MQRHHVYQSLGQKNQMMGCDRELFMMNILVAAALIFLSVDTIVTVLSLSLALFVFYLLHNMGKKDLLLRHVYIRQLKYKRFYLAQANIKYWPKKQYNRKL